MSSDPVVNVDLADHRPDVYREDGRWVFRASSFGGCDQNLIRQAVGLTPDAKPQFISDAMANSAGAESKVIKALSKYGWRALDGLVLEGYGAVDQSGQLELEMDVPGQTGGIVRCHPDGVVQCFKAKLDGSAGYQVKDRAVLEVKVMSGERRDILAGSEWYRWQTSIEMAVTGLPLLWVLGWKDENKDLCRLEDGSLDLTVAYMTEPTYTPAQIRQRLRYLVRAIDAKDAGGEFPDCNIKQFPCGFWQTHDKTKGAWKVETVDVGKATQIKMRRLAKMYEEAALEADAAKERADKLKAQLHAIAVQSEVVGSVDVGGYIVQRIVREGSLRFDKAAAIKDVGEEKVKGWYKKSAPSDFTTVNRKDK